MVDDALTALESGFPNTDPKWQLIRLEDCFVSVITSGLTRRLREMVLHILNST